MAVIDEIIVVENSISKSVDSADNKTIDLIRYENKDYHFAEETEVSGKNLFDILEAENGTLASQNGTDLSVDQYPNRCRSGFIKLSAGSYVVSFNELLSTGNYLHRYSSNNQDSWLGSLTFTKSGSVSTFTLTSDCYIRFTIQPLDTSSSLVLNTETLAKYEPQLEKGSARTEYEMFSGYENNSRICENAVNEPIVDMQLKGNSSQDGTPTPETPIEIESIGHLGKNLCGGRNLLVNQLIGNSANGVIVDSTVYNTMYIEVEEGETYSFTGFVRADGTSLKGCYYDSNGAWVSAFEETTVTIPTGVKYVGRSFNKSVAEVQFEKGQPTDYEPYGYRIPVKARGKNLFGNYETLENQYIDASGNILEKEGINTYRYIKVEPNKVYTISGKSNSKGYIRVAQYDVNKVFVTRAYNSVMINPVITITTTSTTKYLALCPDVNFTDGTVTNSHIYDIQIEQSETATDYESYVEPISTNIYLNEPLRKICDYADYLDLKNKTIVRKIASEFIDTVEYMSGDNTTYKKFLTDIKYKPLLTGVSIEAKGFAVSNKFQQSNVVYREIGGYPNLIQTYITTAGVNRIVYTFDDSSIITIAQAQPLIKNGFEICYVMADTIEETIEVPEISTLDGTTTFEIETQLEPSGLSVKYWKQI